MGHIVKYQTPQLNTIYHLNPSIFTLASTSTPDPFPTPLFKSNHGSEYLILFKKSVLFFILNDDHDGRPVAWSDVTGIWPAKFYLDNLG